MNHTLIGMAVGAVLALTWIAFGFWAFLFVAVAITLGAGVGRVLEGKLSLAGLADVLRGRKSS
ncbi:DUF2273 domain-containing protein [Mycetocola spongiae]|uniref:DUF2273 domain-containing protein n=1 Tax=Mycetocola spongiae TaxID=2859226 RepID=UPI001CF0EBCB|nr:DUF2273 domain-containing protein [Mycetocola spongiae]UCR88118.1 DUF2273 domain-containing protein [Mycetocola spongiae]